MNVNNGALRAPYGISTGGGSSGGVNYGQWSDIFVVIGQPFNNYTNKIYGEFHRSFGFSGYYSMAIEAPSLLDVRTPEAHFTGKVFATAFTLASDRRLKTEIEPIVDPVGILSHIGGVSYRFDKESDLAKKAGLDFPAGRQIGVLAQDVEKVLPEAVVKDGNGVLSVNYNGLTGVLIEAIKQQQKELDAMRSELKALREQKRQ